MIKVLVVAIVFLALGVGATAAYYETRPAPAAAVAAPKGPGPCEIYQQAVSGLPADSSTRQILEAYALNVRTARPSNDGLAHLLALQDACLDSTR